MAQATTEVIGLDELQDILADLGRTVGGKGIVNAIYHGGLAYEREVKKHIRKRHLILTGNYRASVATDKKSDEVWVWTAVIYAAIHEFGGTIVPRRAKALMFEIDGHFVQVQKVEIPARPHWRPALQTGKKAIAAAIVDAVRIQHHQVINRG